jgi:asparagine synthase (glutamine-hydrolysing)
MCGIAGIFDPLKREIPSRHTLHRMINAMAHRGPDERGFHSDADGGLAHARLSIIDLASGQQPMSNEDGSVWVTFNGEIFNYVELREDLLAKGHAMRTHSDTEVIVHAYEDKGPACVEDFNGDFAFAIIDKRRGQLMLARDRMGVRPVYYAISNGVLVFASEVKAILQYPGIRAELDPIGLDQSFTFWFPLAPRTIFKNIFELPPGHILIAGASGISTRRYWDLRFPMAAGDSTVWPHDEKEVAEELESLLLDATKIRLRADVPVGAYLSGGLDSSAVTALIRLCKSSKLRTFSVGFESPEFDESQYQQEVVRALKTDHQSILCTNKNIADVFPDVIRHTERPILRTAPAPLYRLAQFVRENGFKVVLTGEGADEIFAGYDIFKETKVRRFWARQPGSAWRPRLLRRLYPYLAGLNAQPQAYLQAFFKIGLDKPMDPFFSHLPRWHMTSRLKTFFSPELRRSLDGYNAVEELRGKLPPEYKDWHWLSQAQYLEAGHLLPGYILSSQGDRVSMAHAVEGRFPFLDHRVVEFAGRIPPRLKLRGLDEKHILRRAVGRHLPASIADRRKQPYRAPDSQCFFGKDAPEYVEELLSSRTIAESGYFDPSAVEKLVQKCRQQEVVGFRDNMSLVGILSVQLLDRQFVRHESMPEPQVNLTASIHEDGIKS